MAGRTVTISLVAVDRMSRAFRSAGNSADSLAGNLKSAQKAGSDFGSAAAAIARAGAIVAAIPSSGPAAAGLAALAPSALAAATGITGLAAVAIPAINRIKAAMQAQTQAQAGASAEAAQGQARALAMAGAQQALASAVRDAAEAHKQALERVSQAERSLADDQRSAKQAQDDVNAARKEAKQDAEDLATRLIDAQLSVRGATLDVTDAQTEYNQLLADPKATDSQRKRAQLAIDEAKQRLKEQQQQIKQLQEDQKKADKDGIDGSDKVKAAREKLAEANRQVTDSERALSEARANVGRADQKSAESVANARRALTAASMQGAGASSALGSAMSALSPSARKLMGQWQGLTGAFDKWQRSMEPKVLPLLGKGIAILRGQLPSLTPVVTGAAKAVGGLLDRVGVAAKSSQFVLFKKQLTALVPTALTGFGNAALDVIKGLMGIVQAFMPSAPGMLHAVDSLTAKFAAWGTGLGSNPGFAKFMTWARNFGDLLAKNGPQIASVLGEVAAALIHVGTSLVPVAGVLGMGAVSSIGLLAQVVNGMSPGQIQAIAYAFVFWRTATVAMTVASTAFTALTVGGDFIRGLMSVSVGAAEGASSAARLGSIIRLNVGIARMWAVELLGQARAQIAAALAAVRQRVAIIATAVAQRIVAGATRAWAVAQGILNAVMSGNPIALVIIAVVALVAAIVIAYKNSATFRAIVQATWAGIQTAVMAAWNFLKPIFMAIGQFLMGVLKVAFIVIWNTVKIVWIGIQIAIGLAWAIIKVHFYAIKFVITNVLAPIFRWLWNNVIRPVWNFIKQGIAANWAVIKAIFGAIKNALSAVLGPAFVVFKSVVSTVWGGIKTAMSAVWNSGIRPIFDGLKTGLGKIKDAFHSAVDGIKTIWGKLKDIAKIPVNFVIGLYNNGIVKLVNGIAGVAGIKTRLDKIPTFARGGVMPGYAPGRDSLLAAVSPGESIFRPEFTKAVGHGWVHQANDIARKKGTGGVRNWLGTGGAPLGGEGLAFARGGVVPGFAGHFDIGGIVSGWVNKAKDFALGPIEKAAKSILDKVLNVKVPGSGMFHDALQAIPTWIKDHIFGWLKDKSGGAGGPGMANALTWAKAQSGKPYVWGGVGPGGYDCSGFMSAITNVIHGKSPYSRMFSTHSFDGSSGPGGFVRNLRSGFQVGVTNAGVGHMSGTLLGTNVESNGSQGVHYGPGARGFDNSLFPAWYGLKADTGALALAPGWNPPVMNGTGRTEYLETPRRGGGGNTYNINVNVPVGANKAAIGAEIVSTIQEYEKRSGKRWRS